MDERALSEAIERALAVSLGAVVLPNGDAVRIVFSERVGEDGRSFVLDFENGKTARIDVTVSETEEW